MKGFRGLCGLVWLCAALPATAAESLEQRVREAASLIYIHGMNAELARQQIPAEGVPILLDLLRERDFPRRDNVVAFLAFLADDRHIPALLDYLDNPVASDERPEDHRARVLIPTALGWMAARGNPQALASLNSLGARAREKSFRDGDLRQTIEHGLQLAVEAPESAPSNRPASNPILDAAILGAALGTGGDASTQSTESIDPDPNIERISITAGAAATGVTYANHPDNNAPVTDARVDEMFRAVELALAKDETAGSFPDVACCIQFNRVASGVTFGSAGDGLDTVTSNSELNAVMNNLVARFKVVDVLNYCGGPDVNIIGCAWVNGDGIVVERLSGDTAHLEGLLWIHEFGHNVGLNHQDTGGYLMSPSLSAGGTRLEGFECTRFHAPLSGAHLNPIPVGECHDDDDDLIVSSADNCVSIPNASQVNSDTDKFGDACDNCTTMDNPDQANCDNDLLGDVCDPSSGPPGPVQSVGFATKVQITWTPISVQKRVYRGSFVAQPFVLNDVVIGTVSALQNQFTDNTMPSPGQLLYYLVRGVNGCGEGP